MKQFLLFGLLIIVNSLFGQQQSNNFVFEGLMFTIESEHEPSGYYKIVLKFSEDNKQEFTIQSINSVQVFETAFETAIKAIFKKASKSTPRSNTIKEKAREVFITLILNRFKYFSENKGPISGKLETQDTIPLYDNKDKVAVNVKIKDIDIEFLEGYIARIKVNGETIEKYPQKIRFENKYGIGFSTNNNYRKLIKIRLFNTTYIKPLNSVTNTNFKLSTNSFYIKLGELLEYDTQLSSQRRDFSPKASVVKVKGGEDILLHKDETKKLFEAKIFSDFLGFDDSNSEPNGLIQTEISKRINLVTYLGQTSYRLSPLSQGFGFFQYIEPAIVISKIESNNRYLSLAKNDSIILSSTGLDSVLIEQNYVTPINLLHYQNLSLGLDLNLFFIENSYLKFNLYLNGGFRFGLTSVRDSIRNLNANTGLITTTNQINDANLGYFSLYPSLVLHFMPDERYGLKISNKFQYFTSVFSKPHLNTFNDGKLDPLPVRWLNSFEMMMYVQTGKNGRLFGRWRFNHQFNNKIHNFHQLQLGYSFYLLGANRIK